MRKYWIMIVHLWLRGVRNSHCEIEPIFIHSAFCYSAYSICKKQLIEKDPGRAISLFWAAINAGDRIDSALKDMAVVMKQLNRSDEAIEAIKSFRHLCPYDAQESLDNVLVELYKVRHQSLLLTSSFGN